MNIKEEKAITHGLFVNEQKKRKVGEEKRKRVGI